MGAKTSVGKHIKRRIELLGWSPKKVVYIFIVDASMIDRSDVVAVDDVTRDDRGKIDIRLLDPLETLLFLWQNVELLAKKSEMEGVTKLTIKVDSDAIQVIQLSMEKHSALINYHDGPRYFTRMQILWQDNFRAI